MQDNTSWLLGNGTSLVETICNSVGVATPIHLASLPIKDVLANHSLKRDLFLSLPARIHAHFDGFYPSMAPDRLIWTGHASSQFSTKLFRESYATKYNDINWCSIIWQQWIPKKISVLVWRLCHHGLPTDDRIKKLSISLASKCPCCGKDEENLTHLFFTCDLSIKIWNFLGKTFSTACPRGISSFTRLWLGSKPRSFLEALSVAMSCCSLWEIWRYRNELIHNGKRGNVIRGVLSWASKLQHLINLPMSDNRAGHRSFRLLGLSVPTAGRLHCINSWKPHHRGWTANVAVMNTILGTYGGVIIRDSNRIFKGGTSFPISMHGVHGLIQVMEKALTLGFVLGGNIMSIQTSNIYLGDLLFSKEEELPWDVIYQRRRFLHDHANILIQRVNSGQNNSAIAMACKGADRVYLSCDSLPAEVARAIISDQMNTPSIGYRFQSEM